MQADFEDAGPEFSGDEQALADWIVGDAIEHGFGIEAIDRTKNAGEIDPSDDFSGLRRNTGDAIAVPNIREDLTVDEFQFIQLIDRGRAVANFQAALFLQSFRIENSNLGCSVTQEKLAATGCEAPTFSGV